LSGQFDFEPRVFVAQLTDVEYGEALVEAASPHIHKKIKADGYHPVQQQLRAEFGENIRTATPLAVKTAFIRIDKSLRNTAQNKPYSLPDYLIPASSVAHVPTEEELI